MRCPSCQTSLPAGRRFCGRCGEDLNPESGSTQAPMSLGSLPAPVPPPATAEGELPLDGRIGRFAPWWRRAIALFIDSALVSVGVLAMSIVATAFTKSGSTTTVEVVVAGVQVVGGVLYYTMLSGGSTGQTIGYRTMGMAVRDLKAGGRIGYGRAFGRLALRSLLYGGLAVELVRPAFGASHPLLLLVALVPGPLSDAWPLIDPRRQTLVDKVVRVAVYLRSSR